METFLLIVVGILGLIAIAQAVRVFELSSDVRGKDDESTITDKDNNTQGILMLIWLVLMMGAFVWMMVDYGDVILPTAASEHGVHIDNLMLISMGLIIVAFVLTQPLLFGFAYRFRGNKRRKAVYMEHNNRLEFIWTIIPAIVLAGLIIYGLTTWSDIMNPRLATEGEEEPMVVELYAKQFSWQARYSGEDNELGYANVRLIGGTNTIGVDIDDENALDDIVTTVLHLPVNKPVAFKFRSQDVIHSAFMPHFRVQMNVVPGTETYFTFTPTITTEEYRQSPDVIDHQNDINEIRIPRGDEPYEFDFILMCNKICGSAHYNMQMTVIVETEEEFERWLSEQQTFAEML